MIRMIAAVDSKLGIANDHGIPWQGKVPTDVKYYETKIRNGIKLMGYGLYKELTKPMPEGVNYVAILDKQEKLKPGFEPVYDAREFLKNTKGDIWNLGGALLFASTLDLADELYLTRLDHDFKCTKFFPEFEKDFKLAEQSEPVTENGITLKFEKWVRR